MILLRLDVELLVDLPMLHTLSFLGNNILEGDWRDNRKTINGHESYDNTLTMKSKLN